jgi:transposase-like protein
VPPFLVFAPDSRRVIYTANAIGNMNRQLRKIIKRRGQFPSEDSATKLPWLALRNVLSRPSRSVHTLKAAMNQFAILFGERFTAARD